MFYMKEMQNKQMSALEFATINQTSTYTSQALAGNHDIGRIYD